MQIHETWGCSAIAVETKSGSFVELKKDANNGCLSVETESGTYNFAESEHMEAFSQFLEEINKCGESL